MGVFERSSVKFKNIEIVQGGVRIGLGGVDYPSTDYFVDTTNGADGNSGLGWGTGVAFATIGQAMTDAATLAVRGRVRIFVAPGGYNEDVVTPLNSEHPFGALIGISPTRQSFGGAYIYASTDATPGLLVRARGWLISGFELGCIASSYSVHLQGVSSDGTPANTNPAGVEISDCLMGGWAATSGTGINVTGNGAPHATLRNLHFDGYPGSAIVCTESGTDQPRFWEIDNCVFVDNTNHINFNPRGMKESWVHDCAFMQIGANRTATKQLDNTGGNACMIGPNNILGGDYSSAVGGYYAATDDEWRGNHTEDSENGSAQANPA